MKSPSRRLIRGQPTNRRQPCRPACSGARCPLTRSGFTRPKAKSAEPALTWADFGILEGMVRIKRVYDEPESADGRRVLVDRVWPRGLRKDQVDYDEWLREVAPSPELRRWFRHDPDRFEEFTVRYRAELADGPPAEALAQLREWSRAGPVTLLTSTQDPMVAHTAVLADLLAE